MVDRPTLVQEDDKIFLGSQMNFPEIDKFPDFLKSLGIEEINELVGSLQEVVQIEGGSSKIRGTAKLSEDGVSDTFFELDASDVSFTAYGLTMDLARALLFITPRSPDSWEVNFYSNLNWGDNFRGEGLNLHFSNEENTFKLTGRAQSLQTGGILPALEVNGLTFDQIKFVRDVEGKLPDSKRWSYGFLRFILRRACLICTTEESCLSGWGKTVFPCDWQMPRHRCLRWGLTESDPL